MKIINTLFHSKLIKLIVLFFIAALLGKFAHGTCIANFTYIVNSSTRTVVFTNTSTGSNLNYSWNFGDSTTSGIVNPSKTYSSSGTYTVCLTAHSATDSTCNNTHCTTIVIPNICTSNFTYTRGPSATGDTIQFNGLVSTGNNLEYAWYMDSIAISNPHFIQFPNPVWFFPNGIHVVCLSVRNALDTTCTNTKCSTITVPSNPPCVANFTYTIDSSSNPRKYYFNSSTSTGSNLTYFWTFGDGNNFVGSNPMHQYLTSGAKTVCLKVSSSLDSTCLDIKCSTITVSANLPCIANFTYTRFAASAGDTIVFNSSSSSGNNLQYLWSIGGSAFSILANPVWLATPGTYTVCLRVRNSLDTTCTNTKCSTIVVANPPSCIANFTFYSDSVYSGKIHFTNTSSGSNLIYNWNFGDGTNSSLQHPLHQYSSGGYYTVCLSVTSSTDNSCHSQKCISFNVLNHNCNATFGYYYDSITPGTKLHFYPFYGKSGTAYSWNFGDSSASTLAYPVHQYSKFGFYKVCLAISNPSDSCFASFCDTVNVIGPTGIFNKYSTVEIISAYPNPFNDKLHIDLDSKNIETGEINFIDMTGRILIHNKIVMEIGTNQLEFDLVKLSRGIYLMEIKVPNQRITRRLLK